MAENSKRERLILRVISELTTIPWVKTVVRTKPTMAELSNYAGPMLPLIVVEADLPVPVETKSSRRPGGIPVIVSNLTVRVLCYMLENENPDSAVSNYLDDMWVKMYEDTPKGGLCIETIVKPKVERLVFPPYNAFGIDVILKYVHSTNQI